MEEVLAELVKLPRAGEYLEIRLEKIRSTRITLQNSVVERIRQEEDQGGYVRVLNPKTSWWFHTFGGWDNLQGRVEEAIRASSTLPASETNVTRGESYREKIEVELEQDFRHQSLDQKIALLAEYSQIMREVSDQIINYTVEYQDRFQEIYLANTDGSIVYLEKPDISLSFTAVAKQGDTLEIYRNGVAGKAGFEKVRGQELLAQEVAKKAVQLLSARSMKGGKYDVILDPVLAGVFIHEAFGHLSESDFLYRNQPLQSIMSLGKPIASPLLSVFDNGNEEGLRGSSPFDDELTPTQKTYLIKNGILSGRLHSRETSFLMRETPTGNARAINYHFSPIVRMTNTGIEAGQQSKEELLQDIDRGLLAVEYLGGNTALELFTFSPSYGYLIEKGQVGEMVKNFVLSGNLFDTLGKIDGVGNDFRWTEVGGCGKGSQIGLATPTGSPHLRLRDVLIGGD
ncbi:MAG: TldD protein [Candidatus Atribacteria bacterium]|nr:TldD protein [Candidatus Atribacteria bacterium]